MNQKRKPSRAQTGRLMSQSAAAHALGMHRGTVLARVASGELKSEMVDGTPVITRASVEAYLARQDQAVSA